MRANRLITTLRPSRTLAWGLALLAATSAVAAGPAAGQQPAQPPFNPTSPNVHDPVMAKEGDTYYVFGTGRGIPTLQSKDLITWEQGPPVFTEVPEWTRQALPGFNGDIWAPDIIYYQGRWHLFYACNALPGKPHAAIGHASNATLDPKSKNYRWIDHGKIVQSVMGRDTWQAIDPNGVLDEGGHPWLAFGSFWDGIKLVRLRDDMMGLTWPEEWHSLARRPSAQRPYEYSLRDSQIEAAFIFKRGPYYYLFVSFDLCCRGVNGDYKIAVGRSTDLTGPYFDRQGVDMLDGGGTIVAQGDGARWAAVGHNGVYRMDGKDYLVTHAYSIPDKGASKLVVKELAWDRDGWPVVDLLK